MVNTASARWRHGLAGRCCFCRDCRDPICRYSICRIVVLSQCGILQISHLQDFFIWSLLQKNAYAYKLCLATLGLARLMSMSLVLFLDLLNSFLSCMCVQYMIWCAWSQKRNKSQLARSTPAWTSQARPPRPNNTHCTLIRLSCGKSRWRKSWTLFFRFAQKKPQKKQQQMSQCGSLHTMDLSSPKVYKSVEPRMAEKPKHYFNTLSLPLCGAVDNRSRMFITWTQLWFENCVKQ